MPGAARCSCGWKTRHSRADGTRILCLRVSALPIKDPASGPFVYRLGHLVFNQARGVRLPYGLPLHHHKVLKIKEILGRLRSVQPRIQSERLVGCVLVAAKKSVQRGLRRPSIVRLRAHRPRVRDSSPTSVERSYAQTSDPSTLASRQCTNNVRWGSRRSQGPHWGGQPSDGDPVGRPQKTVKAINRLGHYPG
jgi:hypothetical protein